MNAFSELVRAAAALWTLNSSYQVRFSFTPNRGAQTCAGTVLATTSQDYVNGPAANTSPVIATIFNATNATPIAIATNVAHGLATGAFVRVKGVQGNTAANTPTSNVTGLARVQITVTDATHFTINGSVGNGIYVPNTGVVLSDPATPGTGACSLSQTVSVANLASLAPLGATDPGMDVWNAAAQQACGEALMQTLIQMLGGAPY